MKLFLGNGLRGYLCVSSQGTEAQRFLQLCVFHGLVLWDVCWIPGGCQFFISVPDFRKLQPLCRKTQTKIHIKEKHGLPFFFEKNRKRKAFFLGILICAALLAGFSRHIWEIQITGNYANSTPAILEYLDELDVFKGVSKGRLDCAGISAAIREAFPNVTWVSTKIEGTKLLITVKENDILSGTVSGEGEPADLIAEHSGRIISMVTRKGVPLKKPGDRCEKGEVLVSGRVEIKNDSQEVVRYEYVEADADIVVEYELQYKDVFPMEYEQRVYEEKEKRSYGLWIGDWRISGKDLAADKNQDVVIQQTFWKLTQGFPIPIRLEKQRLRSYKTAVKVYTEEEAREKATDRLQAVFEKFVEKGVEISQNNVKIAVGKTSCESKGSLAVQGAAAKKAVIEDLSQPDERKLEDEQQYSGSPSGSAGGA